MASPDWRNVIRRNNRNSVIVIGIFILMYIALGLLIDTAIYWERYYQAVPVSKILDALVHFSLFPYATVVTTLIAIISLMIVFTFHDRMMLMGTEYHEVTADAPVLEEKQLYNIIEELKIAAGLRYMPRIFIIEADYMNAFASGYSEKSAMVAITRGLLTKLDRDETQAVMAHELSHIRHMDIKLTLMATLLSNIMLMVVDLLFWNAYYRGGSRREGGSGGGWLMLIIILLRYILPLVTMLLLLFLSRTREYMADAGCVELTRNSEPLGRALLKINGDHKANADLYTQAYNRSTHDSLRRTAYIFDPTIAGIGSHNALGEWFSSHPSLEKRLGMLGFTRKN